jgi:hypothetical protein
LTVSEQQAEQTSGETGSLGAGPAVPPSSEVPAEPVMASMPEPGKEAVAAQGSACVESPKLVPEQGTATEAPEPVMSKADAADVHASEPDAPTADEPRAPGRIMIMSAGDRGWANDDTESEQEAEPSQSLFGKRRIAALAAVVLLSALAGAFGGALATAGLTHVASSDDTATGSNHAQLEASIARIDSDILALKAGLEHTSRLGMSQFNKTSERLDKVEKAQVEPAAKLAKLSETVDKLKAAPAPAAVPVAAAPKEQKEVTGSVTPSAAATASASSTAPKVEVGRLPTVEGWILRDVANGGALIEGRQGIYEVYAGDPIPGLGRIDAIRRQDGRWVVVTSRGLIVAR